jgi:hypothetical protein
MNCREFILLLGSAAAAWPVAARAQPGGKLPTIGYLGGGGPTSQRAWVDAFVQRLRKLGLSRAAPSRSSTAGARDAPSAMPRPAQGRCHSRGRNRSSDRGKAGDIGHSDRVPDGRRPGRQPSGRVGPLAH